MKTKEIGLRRIVPNILSDNLEASKKFYLDFLGMELGMDLEWILTFVSKENPLAQINIVQNREKEKVDNKAVFISIEISDVDEMYLRAEEMVCTITYPIRNESWGVRRFFVQDPNGATINLLSHTNR